MLNFSRPDSELQAAAARLASRLSGLFAAEMDRLHKVSQPSSRPVSHSKAKVPPAAVPENHPSAPAASPTRIPLSQRKNVFRMAAGSPLPPRPSSEETAVTGHEQLAQTALKVIEQAGPKLTPDQLRTRLDASFAPVIDRIVASAEHSGGHRKS